MTARWNPPTPIADLFQQLNDEKELSEEGNEIINYIQLIWICYDHVHTSGFFNETLKTWREKPDIERTYANFVSFVTQQEEDRLSNQPTSGTTAYRNFIIDSTVYEKMQEFINQMGPFYQSPSEEESGNDKNCSPNISTTTSANAVTMESIEHISIKNFKITIQNKTEETTIKSHWLHKDTMWIVYPSLTAGLMVSHQIFGTT